MHFIEGADRQQESNYVLDELIAEEHYIRLIEELAMQFYATHASLFTDKGLHTTGRKAYHPAMLLGVLLYGYLNGSSSSRKLEEECKRNLELPWLCHRLTPDHKTLSDFRKDHPEALQTFTKAFNRLLKQGGIFKAIG